MKPGLDKPALVRLLALAALLAALVSPALLQPQQKPQEGQRDGSQTLFTVLAAINAAGYDADLDSNANSPVRKQVRDVIAAKHLESVDALKQFYSRPHPPHAEGGAGGHRGKSCGVSGPDKSFFPPPQEGESDRRVESVHLVC